MASKIIFFFTFAQENNFLYQSYKDILYNILLKLMHLFERTVNDYIF